VFGPTLQLSWLNVAGAKFLRLDLGLFFEFPGPTKVLLFGSARAEIPPVKDAPKLLQLRLDFVGFVDFPKQVVEFDATLIKSHALYVFHLTGDAAFRLHWGDPPYLALSLGGFHPRFKPEPAVFPELTRLALTFDNPVPGLFFRVEAYFAVTSNTVQFGGRVELGYRSGSLNVVGFLSLDALIQFSPFYFELTFSAGVRLRWNETTLAGVRLEGVISGPGPLLITGKACFEILWFDICADVTLPLGPSVGPALAAVGSVVQALRQELTDPANLAAVGGDDAQAAQQPRPGTGGRPLVSPLGSLQWTQKRAPFDVLLDRFEGQPLDAQQSVVVDSAQAQGAVRDWFSPGSFANLSESEALNRPAFERLDAGVGIGFGPAASAAVRHDVQVVEIRLPEPPRFGVDALAFAAVVLDAARARIAAPAVRTATAKVKVTEERFAVRDRDGGLVARDRSVSDAHQQAKATGAVALHEDDLVDVWAV
jgi:hypothetical protein